MEAFLSAQASLLLCGSGGGTGLVVVGPSSSGKTTALKLLGEDEDMFYRSDDLTPASFVSHDASKSEDQLAENDLLPKLAHRSLISRDMSTWFAGEQEEISKRMAMMTYLLDGEGFTRDTGAHGRRGYTGLEYRFNVLGASTPLPRKAWWAMGNAGSRLVFHEKRGEQDVDAIVASVTGGRSYDEKTNRVQGVVADYLASLWETSGGPDSVDRRPTANKRVDALLGYLGEIVQHARATTIDGVPHRENPTRIISTLYNIAQGHALLYGRQTVEIEDLQVCARIALSTMPHQLRPVVRALLDPANEGRLAAATAEKIAGVSRPTAIDRLDDLVALGFATEGESEDDGRNPKVVDVRPKFEWPTELGFPTF